MFLLYAAPSDGWTERLLPLSPLPNQAGTLRRALLNRL
jgi:hypothetical protein